MIGKVINLILVKCVMHDEKPALVCNMVLGVSPILLMVSGIKKTREIQILENNNKSQKIKSKHEN